MAETVSVVWFGLAFIGIVFLWYVLVVHKWRH
jgi:hypothetical protein